MKVDQIISQLANNKQVFNDLLKSTDQSVAKWKPSEEHWGLLEVVGHLCDEEKLDFKARIRQIFDHPELPPPSVKPLELVVAHKYAEQEFDLQLTRFIDERTDSIKYLEGVANNNWSAHSTASGFEERTAFFYLTNWLAHDILHIKQIIRLQYDYLSFATDIPLEYAGTWR